MKRIFFTLLLGSLWLSGCSTTRANISQQFVPEKVQSLAILPLEYASEVQREKVDSLRNAVESELKNSGFEVLADRVVRQVCSTPACPERKILASKYLVDGFVTISVRSVQR